MTYNRMQSMNQSLLALLAHGEVTYEEAEQNSPDPEDLSLKIRRMFPRIAEQNGDEMPSPADFSEIVELQQFRRLYEEQEEKTKIQMREKDEEIMRMQQSVQDRDGELGDLRDHLQQHVTEIERMKGDYGRLKNEAQQKIDKLMERIKELNQRLTTR